MMIDTRFLKRKYKLNPDDICYIGANEGQELPEMIQEFPDSKIHCFEPQRKPFKILVKNFETNKNIYFYNFALGQEDRKLKIFKNTNNKNMSSSILHPKEHKKYHPNVLFEGEEIISQKIFSNLNLQNINYLNMDVQGYELEVLKGFESLETIKYIKTEVNRKELYEENVLVQDLDKFLKEHSFVRVETIWHNRTIPWGDAFYIRRNEITKIMKLSSTLKNKIQSIKGYFWILSLLIKFKIVKK